MEAVKYSRALCVTTFGLIVAISQPAVADRARGRVYCGKDGDTPTTLIDNGSRTVGLVRWTRDFSPEWNPQKRCEQVSKKFAQNQESGALVEIVPARANGYPVVCAAPNKVDSVDYTCPDAQILITLRPEDYANRFVDQLWKITSSEVLSHSSALTRINRTSNLNFSRFTRSLPSTSCDIPPTRKHPLWGSDQNLPSRSESSEVITPSVIEKKQPITFACIMNDKKIATVARTSKGDVPIIIWTSNFFNSSGWSPELRCKQSSQKFEYLRQNDSLNYITSGKINGYPVICGAKAVNDSCTNESILFTLKENDDPLKVLNQIFLSNVDVPVDENGFGKKDGRDFVCLSRGASGSCSGLLIMANEL